jgi:membrane fusion protein, adhesin transport system
MSWPSLERNVATLGEQVTRADDQEGRAIVRAPIDGFVKNLKYVAMGNVVKAGEPIMEIVPTKDQLVLEAKLMPADRGYVKLGQDAVVKISAYDFTDTALWRARFRPLPQTPMRAATKSSTSV